MEEAERIAKAFYAERRGERGEAAYRIKVASHSTEGIDYEVVVYQNGDMECDCPAGFFGNVPEEHKHFVDALGKLTPFQRSLIKEKRKKRTK